jgi:hypothetical protein
MKKIFVSHNFKDHDFTNKLISKLERDFGDRIWIDDWEIDVGDSIVEKVNEGLETSSFIIVVFSPNSIRSLWVKKELNSSLMNQLNGQDIKILPVLIKSITFQEIPFVLQDIKGIRIENISDFESEYIDLTKPIKKKYLSESYVDFIESYNDDIQHINLIIDKEDPTRQEIRFILQLISNSVYFNYFFRNLKNEKFWFVLRDSDFFNPDRFPLQIDGTGRRNALFTPLIYFDKLSEKINNNEIESEKYSNELIKIIKNVSTYLKKKEVPINLRTCWFFVRILGNLPTKFISLDIIEDHISYWISTEEGVKYLEREIIELLFRGLISSDDPKDWLKAEALLTILLKTYSKSVNSQEGYFKYDFDDYLKRFNLYPVIGVKVSEDFINFVVSQIEDYYTKKYFYKISFKVSEELWDFKLNYKGDKIFIFEEESKNVSGTLTFDPKESEEKLIEILISKVPEVNKNKISDININYELFSKHYHSFSHEHDIFDDTKDSYDKDIRPFIIMSKNILAEWCQINNVHDLLNDFLSTRHDIFIRISLYLIDANWEHLNSYFFRILNKPERILHNSVIALDIKAFLRRNVSKFTGVQKNVIKEIIEKGPYKYITDLSEEEKKTWRLKWYFLVKNDPFFESSFKELQDELNISDSEIQNEAKVTWYHDYSPKTLDEINRMEISEIHQLFKTFQPDSFSQTSIRELANTSSQLLKINPKKLYEIIEFDGEIPYAYVERIINAFEENWKTDGTRKNVNIEKSISFVEKYLNNIIHENKKLISESDVRFDSKYVAGTIASFIATVNESEKNDIPEKYLKRCRKVILVLTENIQNFVERGPTILVGDKSSREYTLNHSLNTTQGKILIAHFQISQRYALRNKEVVLFREDLKNSLKKCFDLKIDDAFTVFGTFITSYAYWDQEFTFKIIKEFERIDDESWKSFFGGWLFWNVKGYSPQLHKSLKPHYKKAIKSKFDIEEVSLHSGLIRRITIAYYWGYEDLDGEIMNLAFDYLSFDKLKTLIQTIHFDYKEIRKDKKIYKKVYPLWDKLITVLKKREGKGKDKAISELLTLSNYAEKLDEKNFQRFLFVLESDIEQLFLRDFVDKLIQYANEDNSLESCLKICDLIEPIVKKHYPYFDENLQKLLNQLFELKYPELDMRLKDICNKIIEVNDGYIDWPIKLVRKYN